MVVTVRDKHHVPTMKIAILRDASRFLQQIITHASWCIATHRNLCS